MDDYMALIDFSVNNTDLDKLESLINAFNPLKILQIEDLEIRNSNVLAWLIDPNGHHGLGDILFKNLLLGILKNSKRNESPQINDVIGANFADLKVMRESCHKWRDELCYIDVLVISPQNKIVVVIENKIKADVRQEQLSKYVEVVEEKYRGYEKVFVLLTLDGLIPKGSDLYIPFTHEQIHDIVQSIVELRKDYMPSVVYEFIQCYLSILGEKTMPDAKVVKLCKKLYSEHDKAIEMIIQHGKPKLPTENIKDFHDRTQTTSIFMGKENVNSYYYFIPETWADKVPQAKKTQEKYLIYWMLESANYVSQKKIILSLNVGKFPEQAKEERKQLIHKITDAAANVGVELNLNIDTQYTKIFSTPILLGDDTDLNDYAAVTNKLVDVYNEKKKDFAFVDTVVHGFEFREANEALNY